MSFTELKNKRLLLLGGSLWKEAINDFARENEIVLIATGNNQSAGIFSIADEAYSVDSTDKVAMKQLIHDARIDGVYMGGSEKVITTACQYINELGLPCYCKKEQWENLQNKKQFKALCVKFGLPVVQSFSPDADHEIKLSNINFPVITKPIDGFGSMGFSVCNNYEELKSGYRHACKCAPSGQAIIEKYVPNDGIVVFYTICNGEVLFSGIEDKYPVRFEKQGSYVGGLFINKSHLEDTFRMQFEDKISKMIESLGISEGSIWIEVFNHGDKFYFNEAGFRYGGSGSVYFVDYFYAINQVAADIYFALTGRGKCKGLESIIPNTTPRCKYYAVYPIYLKPGVISNIKGVSELKRKKNIVTVLEVYGINSLVADTGSFSHAAALVHFVFNTEKELKQIINTVHDTISFLDGEGNEMIEKMIDIDTFVLKNKAKEEGNERKS